MDLVPYSTDDKCTIHLVNFTNFCLLQLIDELSSDSGSVSESVDATMEDLFSDACMDPFDGRQHNVFLACFISVARFDFCIIQLSGFLEKIASRLSKFSSGTPLGFLL